MIKKIENCIYCGEKMADVKSAKRKFCNDICRIYYKRELDRGSLSVSEPQIVDITAKTHENKQQEAKKPVVATIPIREGGIIDFSHVLIFKIEEFTQYPEKQRPQDKIARSAWDLQKKLSDNEIRIQWNEHRKTIKLEE